MTPLIYIIAGEPSGDQLGGRLMAALREETGGAVEFAGVGGESMGDEGLRSLFPLAELAVMGLAEVLPRVPNLLRRIRQTVADIEGRRPAAVVTIDSWGFTGRVAKALKRRGSTIPRIHYVAPMVWAWGPGRARHLADRLDLLLTLLPNEPPYFEAVGLRAVHVGHPVIESGADRGDGAAFRRRHGIPGEAPLLCVLPGSRLSETSRLLPVFEGALTLLKERFPTLRALVPTTGTVAGEVAAAASSWPLPALVIEGRAEKYDAFAAADVALAASGTVALELALAEVPSVITYRVAPLTAAIGRRLISVKYVNLINLLLDRPVVPELLQDDCRPEKLAADVATLLEDAGARRAQKEGLREGLARLGYGGPSPSRRAARAVLDAIAIGRMENAKP